MKKAIEIAKEQSQKAVIAADEVKIENPEDLKSATEILSKINVVGKFIKQKKEGITKPLLEALKNARDMFRPIENQYQIAETTIKNKMFDYGKIVEEKQKKEEERLAKRLDKGTMKEKTVLKKLDEIETPEKNVKAETGSIQYREVKKVEVVDENLLPRNYLIPDFVKIRREALAGKKIAGVEVKIEKTIANTTV